MPPEKYDPVTIRFTKGLLLTWIPFLVLTLPTLIMLVRTMIAVHSQKATGLGVVAGGISQSFVTFGLVSLIATQGFAVSLLSRTFQKGHGIRSVFSVISICCSVLLLGLGVSIVWLMIRLPR